MNAVGNAGSRPSEPEGRVRPGAFSALLRELVRAPDTDGRTSWDRALRPGAVFGRFELVREVGRGGFGVVYEARDRALGRSVAFKAVDAGAPDLDERALREAEAAARLSHPNVVTIYDVGRCEQGPYLVMELLRGETLAARLEHGRLPVGEATRVFVEVARALAHAHAQGVVHRDLTPSNVHLGDDGRVKVLDFGMARAFGRRQLEGGTPGYMAPEQLRGAPEDERADVFALGVLFHRMLTGALPSGAGAKLVTPEEPALGALVDRMLRADPVERPRDAGEVLAALGAAPEPARAHDASRERAPSAPAPAAWRRPSLRAFAVAFALLLVAGAVLLAHRRAATPAPPASVAVLPFADLSPAGDQSYFAEGVAEQIIDALAHVDGLRVAGRTSSFALKDRRGDLRAIGDALGVATVLEGSVRKAGDRVRITAQLVSLRDGYHLWSETYDRHLGDLFALQDDIARSVATALKVKLVDRAGGARPPSDPEAYRQYLLGRQFYARLTSDGRRRAIAAYRRALELDPSFAPAWAGLAVQLSNMAGEDDRPADARRLRDEALAAAERAVALDPEFAEGYSARALLRAPLRWDWAGAQADMDRAVALAPGDAHIRRRQALLLADLGRIEAAIAAQRKATEADPAFASNWYNLGAMLMAVRDLPAARQAFGRALEIAPDADLHKELALLALLEGDKAAAAAEFERAGSEMVRLMGAAITRSELGDAAGSRRALEALAAKYGAGAPMAIAWVHAWRGDVDDAFDWLRRAMAQHDDELASIRHFERLYPAVRADPRYAALLRAMNMPVD